MSEQNKSESLIHVVKFTFFSLSAGIIQAVSFSLLFELLQWGYWQAYLLALLLSVLWNFTLNRKFTFKSAANVPVAMAKVLAYYVIFTPVSTLLGEYATSISIGEYYVLAVTMIINLVTEYLFTKYVVYKDQINTAVKQIESKQ
jgi:putative flippase GtrA